MRKLIALIVAGLAVSCGDPSVATIDAAADAVAQPDAGDPPACGNGLCGLDETASSCCADCGICTADGATVTMETGVAGGAPGTGVTPGGMIASYSGYAGGPFAEMRFPMNVVEPPVAGAAYFWAQTFYFGTTDQTGYTGLQDGSRCGGGELGKRVIFSIWDALSATPGPDSYCGTFGGEGVGYQCCAPFDWRADVVYTMVVRETATDQWEMRLHDPTVGTNRLIGTINATAAYGRITSTTGFVEYYLQVNACTTTPRAVAKLHCPLADGVAATTVALLTYGTCMAQATATCTGPACQ